MAHRDKAVAVGLPTLIVSLPIPFVSLRSAKWSCSVEEMKNAHEHFRAALTLARNPMERRFLKRRLRACEPQDVTPVATERGISGING